MPFVHLAWLLATAAAANTCDAEGAACERSFFSIGETMVRFAPIDDPQSPPTSVSRHMPQPFLRSVGGDELNVAVALSLVGARSRWISVLPHGPLGDAVAEGAAHHGVEFAGMRVDGDIGTFHVLPEKKSVHFQRRHSAFALHDPDGLDWPELLAGPRPWLHVTGIMPLISAPARESWARALAHAAANDIPTSLDLNHRKQLGTLAELWAVVKPHVRRLELLILSVEQLNGLAELELGSSAGAVANDAPDDDVFALMGALHARWRCRRVALTRKVRDAMGVQRRWSVLTQLGGDGATPEPFSTHGIPVWHAPRDDLGGGSAWAAGMILSLHLNGVLNATSAEPLPPLQALRRADLLAALGQVRAPLVQGSAGRRYSSVGWRWAVGSARGLLPLA